MFKLRCIECNEVNDEKNYTCRCGGLLEVVYDLESIEIDFKLDGNLSGVWKYRSLLPVKIEPVTLKEGSTPLYKAERISKIVGAKVYVKHEGLNPSGSFKDRGMTVGVTKAIEFGKSAVVCASTGNTSASMAMYAAKAGIKAYVLLPAGKVALGKLVQALMHGAKVVGIRGNFDDALKVVKKVCEVADMYLLNSINPYRLEGQKTIAYEISEFLVPSRVFVPIGNAGNISAIYKGFYEFKELDLIDSIPRMVGVQAEKAAPIYKAFLEKKMEIEPIKNPETVATAIRIGNPANAKKALKAIYSSKGCVEVVSDDEIIDAQKLLAKEGIGVEPASAASVAGLIKLAEKGEIEKDEEIVCIATGNLLKDPEIVLKICGEPEIVEPSVEAVLSTIKNLK
ncbi:MAG: threonine synthase [Archaeoglobaceae archaeon]|nr:threonine synthase [Archaeoglobaceae archaeon]MCX8152509.1 threonine synthase [Archaeoglobaceae archaeon]MDW8013613.1 threonine synthase [Archaeoglobaceae archaeon]